MNSSKLVKTSALFGLLAGILLGFPVEAMMGTDPKDDKDVSSSGPRAPRQSSASHQRAAADTQGALQGFPSVADIMGEYVSMRRAANPGGPTNDFVERLASMVERMRTDPLGDIPLEDGDQQASSTHTLLPVTSSVVQEDPPTSLSLHPKILSDFLLKMQGFPLEYRTSLGDRVNIRFRLMLDGLESLHSFRALDAGANEDKYKELMMRSAKGVENIIKVGQLTDLGWFFSCSDNEGNFTLAGWAMFSRPKVLQLPLASLPVVSLFLPPPHPEMVVAGPPSGFFERHTQVLHPIIHSFFKRIGTWLDVMEDVSPEERRGPLEGARILEVMMGDTSIIPHVAARFNLGSLKMAGEALPYTAVLLSMDSGLKGSFIDFQTRLLVRQKREYGEDPSVNNEDKERTERLYNEAVHRQGKALLAYRAHLQDSNVSPNLSGLTWIIGQKEPSGSFRALGTMIINASGKGTQSHFDLDQDDPRVQPISMFFTGQLGRQLEG